jgi:ribosome-associated translation inhibitor RaiA
MVIQFETPHSLNANEAFKAPLIAMLNEKLDRFNREISRLEVHLSDENGKKTGAGDKRCLLEAHIAAMPHVVVTDHSDSFEQAVDGASDKLIASLHSIHEHEEHSHRTSKQQDEI